MRSYGLGRGQWVEKFGVAFGGLHGSEVQSGRGTFAASGGGIQ